MKKGEQFKIESVEELKEAYEMFEDEWVKSILIEHEIKEFNHGYRWIIKNEQGVVYLDGKYPHFKTIPSPIKKESKEEEIKRLEKRIAELKALPKIKLQVHDRFKFLAFDSDGGIYIYSSKPQITALCWDCSDIIHKAGHLPQKTIEYLNSLNWKESLHEIDHIE